MIWYDKFKAFGDYLRGHSNVNVARFARNVEWDFFCDFQTLCMLIYNSTQLIYIFALQEIRESSMPVQ